MRIRPLSRLISIVLVLCAVSSCSPYLFRASWEEAGILLRRERIEKLLSSPSLEPELKNKLALVLEARSFAMSLGLTPKKSFTYYSKIDRDVLVWVVSGAKKTAFEPVTWWYPIVGRVPYKGFFEKSAALNEAANLEAKNFDTYFRPSAAFSTLGWFNDPVLSTVLRFNEVSVVNTVIHEIVHTTVWVKNQVSFNETLANFIGSIGAEQFYRTQHNEALANAASDIWADELIFAQHLNSTYQALSMLYNENLAEETVGRRREEIFDRARTEWQLVEKQLRTKNYSIAGEKLNNASILANQLYLDRIEVFEGLYHACHDSLPDFIAQIKTLVKNKPARVDIYESMIDRTRELKTQ